MRKALVPWLLWLGTGFLGVAGASPVRFFQWNSPNSHGEARLLGVSVSAEGVLELAPRFGRRVALEAPEAYAVAATATGWAVGTGEPARVIFLDRDGSVREVAELPDRHVMALAEDGNGAVLVGTAPQGRVFRARPGAVEELFETGASYVWALARSPSEGAVWVATGNPGRLIRYVEGGKSEVLFESREAHLRSLRWLRNGSVVFGTSPLGRVQRYRPDTKAVETVFDSDLEEVVGLEELPSGALLAALNAGDPAGPETPVLAGSSSPAPASGSEPVPVVTVEISAPTSAPSLRPSGARSRSELVEISLRGSFRTLWQSAEDTIHGLQADGEGVWIGTGKNGRLWQLSGREVRRVHDLEDRFIVGFASAREARVAATTQAPALWYFEAVREAREGIYESEVVDAGQPAAFGELRWRGELPSGSRVRVAARTGWSREIDGTWSPWSPWQETLPELPIGRFAQLRIELRGSPGKSPRLVSWDWAYRQVNLPPVVERIQVLEPGQILVPASFNPADQVYEPASPNRDGIFTTLEPALPRDERMKTLWRRGWRTVRWKAVDPNQDELRGSLAVRREEPGKAPGPWLEVVRDVSSESVSFDASVLPDGLYRFRLQVSDLRTSGEQEALESEAVSELVIVDHTPPRLEERDRSPTSIVFELVDGASPLREVSVSFDGKPWTALVPQDGLLDGRRERFRVELPAGSRWIVIRAGDAAFNFATFELGEGGGRR